MSLCICGLVPSRLWFCIHCGPYNKVVFTIEKHLRVSGPAQFKPALFKDQMNIHICKITYIICIVITHIHIIHLPSIKQFAFSLVFWVPPGFLSVYLKGNPKGFRHAVCSAQDATFPAIFLRSSWHSLIFISFKS